MTKKYDLRNDPKFANRVKKLEGNQYARVLKNPLRVSIEDQDWFVAVIGQNDAFMIVNPSVGDGFMGFQVLWTKNDGFNTPNRYHDAVQMAVHNWLMMHAEETSFVKRKHLDIKIVEMAIETCSKVVSQETMAASGPTFRNCVIQTIFRDDIPNPYHKG